MQKNYRLVEYIPVICFNKFVQSAVNARREGQTQMLSRKQGNCLPKAPTASKLRIVVATVTKYLSNEKTHGLSTQNCSSVRITSMINCMK